MALSVSLPPSGFITLLLLLFVHCLLSPSLAQSPPTLAQCEQQLLPLATPCIPFVQGQTPSPADICCSNLKQVYDTQRSCICLFLNGTALLSLPINSTRALQLPGMCSPQMDMSTCSAPARGSGSGRSQGSVGSAVSVSKPPATATPPTDVAPTPSMSTPGTRTVKNSASKLKSRSQLGFTVAVIPLLVLVKLL